MLSRQKKIAPWFLAATAVGSFLCWALQAASQTNSKAAEDLWALWQSTVENPTNRLGSWIWAPQTFDSQTCRFWRSFEIPASTHVTHAELWMSVDNEFDLFLDGRNLGRGGEWRELSDFNITYLLGPGPHVLAVEAYNESDFAGMIFGMAIDLSDGRRIEIKSDQDWRIVPNEEKAWEARPKPVETWGLAKIIAPMGMKPWITDPVWPQRINMRPTLLPIKLPFWQSPWFQGCLFSVCGVAIAVSLRLVGQLAIHRREKWLLQKERGRIARDIHDDVGWRLTQLVLHGEVAQSDLPPDSAMRVQLDKICEDARGVLSTMDEILWAVSPKRDTFLEFTTYVCNYAQEFLKSTPIQCLFNVAPETSAVALDLPLRRALLMAIKESLNNAAKYSEASELVLSISIQNEKLLVVVADNGKGFDPAKLGADRNGLTNMTDRVQEVGGSCAIASEPGKGCKVEFCVPLARPRRGLWQWLHKSAPTQEQEHVVEAKLL